MRLLPIGTSAAFLDTTLIVCPLESIKVREMTTTWSGGRAQMMDVFREEGVGLLFRGWNRVFYKQVGVLAWARCG